jgi:hypothetical protein
MMNDDIILLGAKITKFTMEIELPPQKKERPAGTHGTENLIGSTIEKFEICPGTGLAPHSPAFFKSITIRMVDGKLMRIGPNGNNLYLTTYGLDERV